jgi:malonate transporter
MQAVIEVVVPVFGLIACGYLLARTPLLSAEGLRGLTNFVFYVAIPALLFRTLGRGLPGDTLDLSIIYAYFGGCAVLYALTMAVGRFAFGIGFVEQALFGMGAVFSNTVMLGIPLVFTAFGEAGMAPITLIVAFHSVLLIGSTTILVEFGRNDGEGVGASVLASLLALVKNPVIVALIVGVGWGVLSLPIPPVLDRFVALLSGAAAPCALAALGASLVQFKLGGDLRESAVLSLLKLVVHPVIVWLFATYLFPMDPVWRAVAVIVAALPVGANVFVLAQKYDIYVARSASGVLITTVVSVFTVGLLIALLAPVAG